MSDIPSLLFLFAAPFIDGRGEPPVRLRIEDEGREILARLRELGLSLDVYLAVADAPDTLLRLVE
ncbi:MAG: hypothetical protein EXR62_09740 [Chloroflexi bacterium]|nr:hypothetical protein [Chloroflexota bacterium]